MLGVLLFLCFLVLGIAISNRLFFSESIMVRGWAGCLLGILGLMWCVMPFSFAFKFSVTSHILGLLLVIAVYALVRFRTDLKGSLSLKFDATDRTLLIVALPISAFIVFLLTTHVLSPGAEGVYSGQSTWGDLSMHLGIVSSIATQGTFPPDYSIFPGHLLSYPFLTDSLSSSLYLFGTPLRWAVLIPSYLMVTLLVMGFFILANEILKHKIAAAFSTLLFFFNGGFGFIYFMDGLLKDPSNLTRIFTEFYKTPTNFNENYVRWSNTICDMIIPQRTSMAGWMFVIFAFWLLNRALNLKDKKYFILSGIVAGLMPMIHTHSFLAFGITAIVWCIVYFFNNESENKVVDGILRWSLFAIMAVTIVIPSFTIPAVVIFLIIIVVLAITHLTKRSTMNALPQYVLNWVCFGLPALALALPQLLFWTFPQASGEGFKQFQTGWSVNDGDSWVWFWIKNIGLVLILMLPAMLAARRRLLNIFSGAVLVFAVANVYQFQPNSYDNNKLLYVWFMFAVILVSAYVWSIYKRMDGLGGRRFIIGTIIVFCTFSAVLTMIREVNSSYLLFSNTDLEAAEYIKENTPPDARFITSDNHNNAVASLTGRSIYSGSGTFLAFHGVNYNERSSQVEQMYTQPDRFEELAKQCNIDYVYFSSYEAAKFNVGPSFFQQNCVEVFHKGDVYVFAVSERARSIAAKTSK